LSCLLESLDNLAGEVAAAIGCKAVGASASSGGLFDEFLVTPVANAKCVYAGLLAILANVLNYLVLIVNFAIS